MCPQSGGANSVCGSEVPTAPGKYFPRLKTTRGDSQDDRKGSESEQVTSDPAERERERERKSSLLRELHFFPPVSQLKRNDLQSVDRQCMKG